MDWELYLKLDIILSAILIYFIPSVIAYFLKHHFMKNIFILNLILGWTGVAWVALCIYSIFSKPKKRHKY